MSSMGKSSKFKPFDHESVSENAAERALSRSGHWHRPLNWSRREWFVEARAITVAAAWRAELDYDRTRGVPLSAFAYSRALASIWTRYRQELAYSYHFSAALSADKDEIQSPEETPISQETRSLRLKRALQQLSEKDRWLVERLFWSDATEAQIAELLGVTQQAVSKRKRRILRSLRNLLQKAQLLYVALQASSDICEPINGLLISINF